MPAIVPRASGIAIPFSRAPVPSPLVWPFSWYIRAPLDNATMARAAEAFIGRHDFAGFRSAYCNAKTTVKEIFSIAVYKEDRMLIIDVRGNGFLRNMVRRMVGTPGGNRSGEKVALRNRNHFGSRQ